MAHVVSTRKAQTPRQPSFHVNAPIDLLRGYQINRPTHEDPRRKSEPQAVFEETRVFQQPLAIALTDQRSKPGIA
jgi:hypothetical protein